MLIENALFIFLRKVDPSSVIRSWVRNHQKIGDSEEPYLYRKPKRDYFKEQLTDHFSHYSINEADSAYRFFENLIPKEDYRSQHGILGMLSYAVKDIFRTDIRRECLCKYEELIRFRELSHVIDPLIFQTAYLADMDKREAFTRKTFSWPVTMRTDNIRLHHILDRGMAENHFHIGGSVSSFMFSWICLMNHFDAKRARDFIKMQLDNEGDPYHVDTYYSLVFKAACIRCFLFSQQNDQALCYDRESSEKWLEDRLNVFGSDCDAYADELNIKVAAFRELCLPDTDDGFVPDYAMKDEPLPPLDDDDVFASPDTAVHNYERRLYRPLAGEQRFMYRCFRMLYEQDPAISCYGELIYAYLLIYCKLRGLMTQNNHKYGLGNFIEYDHRKNNFTRKYRSYSDLRNRIAQQAVLCNPQVIAFEGRLCPEETAVKNKNKIKNQRKLAIDPYYSASYYPVKEYEAYKKKLRENAEKKLHYVLHFPKIPDRNLCPPPNCAVPARDAALREKNEKKSNAILSAKIHYPDIMASVSGIDACSNEIGCRPEVFACAFRRLRQWKIPSHFSNEHREVPSNCRLTYHAGEDFLCVIDGLRAIDEARGFLEMRIGDRFGHALALGIDCAEWYELKRYKIILPKQDLLDNLVWLYHKLHEYGIVNLEAEHEIKRVFHRLYAEIYLTQSSSAPLGNFSTDGQMQAFFEMHSLSILNAVTPDDYYVSMTLRGNEPELYRYHPIIQAADFEKAFARTQMEPWLHLAQYTQKSNIAANLLYHCYHYHPICRRNSGMLEEYTVKQCIVEAVSAVQKSLQFDLSRQGIGIECNPSSNFLIGTFREYAKHPIIRFNDKELLDSPDNPRLSASINTDDLGIFDTCLENEYALIACALENSGQYADRPLPPEKIYHWLDHIRRIGCEQTFIHIFSKQ